MEKNRKTLEKKCHRLEVLEFFNNSKNLNEESIVYQLLEQTGCKDCSGTYNEYKVCNKYLSSESFYSKRGCANR